MAGCTPSDQTTANAHTWPHTSVFWSITPCVQASRSTGRLQGPRGVDMRSLQARGQAGGWRLSQASSSSQPGCEGQASSSCSRGLLA